MTVCVEVTATAKECVEATATSKDILEENVEAMIPREPAVTVGSVCIARWSEDSVWYNARLDSVGEGGQFQVTFTDYGNSDIITNDSIVAKAEDIPADQVNMIDECVKRTTDSPTTLTPDLEVGNKIQKSPTPVNSSPWSVGDICVACWSEDGVWYNARVESEEAGQYQVIFTDYGNQDNVTLDRIVAIAQDIPADQNDMIDECVKTEEVECSQISSSINPNSYLDQKVTISTSPDGVRFSQDIPTEQHDMIDECLKMFESETERKVSKNSSDVKTTSPSCCPHIVGDVVIARWSEDEVWYNAVIESIDDATGDAHVTFTDYGNSATVSSNKIVATANDIPDGELEMVDECVQLISYLPCLPMTWQYGEKEISTENHLLQDAVLMAFVDPFASNGKLVPVHLQALKNGTLEVSEDESPVLFYIHIYSQLLPRRLQVLEFRQPIPW